MLKIAPLLLSMLIHPAPAIAQPSIDSDTHTGERLARAKQYFGDNTLTDQNGRSHRFFSDLLSRHVVLIHVIFTRCQDACPLQTQRLQAVRKQLGKRFGSDIVFLSLSVDPLRDDPAALKTFAEKHEADVPGWYFLTADETSLADVLRRLGQWTDDPANHGTLLLAGNTRRGHWMKLRPDASPGRITADLLRLATN